MYDIQHCFNCRPSDSTVSEDAGIEPRTIATSALAVRSSTNHSARSHLDVIIEEFLGLELLLAVRALEVPDPLVEILKHSFT
jgi:hypothetical protein